MVSYEQHMSSNSNLIEPRILVEIIAAGNELNGKMSSVRARLGTPPRARRPRHRQLDHISLIGPSPIQRLYTPGRDPTGVGDWASMLGVPWPCFSLAHRTFRRFARAAALD